MTLLETALAYYRAGLVVLPNDPAKKYPAGLAGWQQVKPTEADVRRWFANGQHAIGVRDIEGLDFDNKGEPDAETLYADWAALVERIYPGLVNRLLCERTPSGGYHLVWRCETIAGNQKLATRPPTAAELEHQPKLTAVSLIETRGRGGQFQVAPSPGYTLVRGDWTQLTTISPTERHVLLSCARALSKTDRRTINTLGNSSGERAGDRYNSEGADEAFNLLEQAGWAVAYERDGVKYLVRPGKDEGIGGTFGYVAPGVLYVFTTNGAPFQDGKAYGPFAIYAELKHDGDYKAAARALHARYGPSQAASPRAGEVVPASSVPVTKPAELRRALEPMTGDELLAADIAPPRIFVPSLIRAGLSFFIGQPGVGKTPALVQLAIALATGGLWLGSFRVPKVRVAYIGPEYDRGDIKGIVIASIGRDTVLPDLLIFTVENFVGPADEADALEMIDDLVLKFGVEAVVIDLFTGFLPPEKFKPNAYRGDYREFLAYHRKALEHQIMITGAWHGTKRDTNPSTMYNGGQGFWGAAGGGRLVMFQDEEDQVKLYGQLRGNKAITYTMTEAKTAGRHFWAVVEGADQEPAFNSEVHRAIWRVLRQHTSRSNTLAPSAIASIVKSEHPEVSAGINYVRRALGILAKRGIVRQIGVGYYLPENDDHGDQGDRSVNDDQDDRSDRGVQGGELDDHDDRLMIAPMIGPAPHHNGTSEGAITPIINFHAHDTDDDFWFAVPPQKRTIIRGYLRSNREQDEERARELCEEFALDYDEARRLARGGQ